MLTLEKYHYKHCDIFRLFYVCTQRRTYRGEARYLGPDGDQVLLQEPLLIGDLMGVGRLLLKLLHLLVGHIQHALQLVLEE